MIRAIPLAFALLCLVGCQTTPQGGGVPSAKSQVYAAKTAYQAVLLIAVRYNRLPRCGQPTSPPLCSDPTVVTELRQGDKIAQATLEGAEAVVYRPAVEASVAFAAAASATEAVKLLQTIITTYNIK